MMPALARCVKSVLTCVAVTNGWPVLTCVAVTHPSPEPVAVAVAARVRDLRKSVGMTQTELAERMTELGADWGRTTVAKLEAGRRESVSVGELLALALLFDIPPISLIADPMHDELVPVAEGMEVGSWEALLWMCGAGTLDTAPGHERYQAAADLIWEGRVVAEMTTNLRRIPRFMGDEGEAQRSLDDLHRSHLATMRRALEHIEAMGATLPKLGPHVLHRAEELGIKLPGQES